MNKSARWDCASTNTKRRSRRRSRAGRNEKTRLLVGEEATRGGERRDRSRRDEHPRCHGRQVSPPQAEHTEAARVGVRRTATRRRIGIRRAVAWTRRPPERHRAHGCVSPEAAGRAAKRSLEACETCRALTGKTAITRAKAMRRQCSSHCAAIPDLKS